MAAQMSRLPVRGLLGPITARGTSLSPRDAGAEGPGAEGAGAEGPGADAAALRTPRGGNAAGRATGRARGAAPRAVAGAGRDRPGQAGRAAAATRALQVRSPPPRGVGGEPGGGACGGDMNEQWDVGRALALSGLFHVLQGAGRACAAPFLTLYLRYLGLPAPLVGVVAGAQYLVAALWAPLCSCCSKSRRKRRLLVASSLLGSAGASLLLTLIPPADGDAGYKYCNVSQQLGDRGAATTVPSLGTSSYSVLNMSALMNAKTASKETMQTTADVLIASREPTPTSSAFQGLLGLTDTPEEKGRRVGEGDTKTNGYLDGPFRWTASVKAVNQKTREPEMPASYRPPLRGLENEMSSVGSAAIDLADNAEESLSATESNELSLFKRTIPTFGDAYVSGSLSDHQKDAQGGSFEAVQNIFQDRKNKIFLMVLGAVVLWELLATSSEWTVDENFYEYLDFVDASDRYGKLWIWSYLGASVGACSIAVFVDQLNCFISGTITRLAVHFYGYALLIIPSLLVSVFFPIHVPKKTVRVNKTAKALALLWSDSQAILYTITIVLTGAAGSAVHNFLFWQMQDRGSSELYMGLAVAVGLLAEILLYFFKWKLLRTFSSSKIVVVSLSLLAVQLLCYSFLWTAWSALLIQVLSAFSSGALWWVVSMMVEDIATPGMERSLHTVLQGLCYCGGASLGSFAGGFVVKHFGLAVLYRACCICLVLWLFLFLIVQSKLPRQKKNNYSRLLAADLSNVSDSDEENERDWLVKAMKDKSFNRSWSQQHGIN
ncbi:major facilitator superfamily domain-containing protein 6-like [Nyctibius grandis]|uniref:major facilitator superfamily domain-containing protein 6-like n=1 Tax=Nyctibius grandis TaxID=48427 RepID=UPI0035BC232C